jgi:transcriptional regulator with XRE-family HTH domain
MTARSAAPLGVWRLLRDARHAAGLSQRELARRAGTSQSAIARYETARTTPDLSTLERLLSTCGAQLRLDVVEHDAHDERLLATRLAMTPGQRASANQRITALAAAAAAARRAGRVRRLADA